MSWVRANPAWAAATIEALVAAILNVVIVFGLSLSVEQVAAINGVVLAVLALALGLWCQAPITRLVEAGRAEGVQEGLKMKHD